MTTAHVPKHFHRLLFNKSLSLFKPNVCFSISPHFYSSTSKEKQHAVNPTAYDILVHKHHFSPESASRMASVLTRLKNPENYGAALSFLKESGFSNTQLEKIVRRRPSIMSIDVDRYIKPKIKILQGVGLSADDIAKLVAHDPSVLFRSTSNRIIPSLSVLRRLLGSDHEVANVLRKSGWFLIKDLEETVVPNIEFLKSCSVSMDQIVRSLYSFPRFLLQKPEVIRKYAEKVEEMGVERGSKMFIHAVRILVSMTEETLELKVRTFRDMGFLEDDILRAFRKVPLVFAISEEKLKKVREVVVSSGKYDVSCIINHPTSLICSIEKRYKPRLRVLGVLESKNLIKEWPSFKTFFNIADEKFYEKYVSPYLVEVGDVYMAKS